MRSLLATIMLLIALDALTADGRRLHYELN